MGNLSGQVALVIGLDDEAARAVTAALAERGADVAVASDDWRTAESASEAVVKLGRRSVPLRTDGAGAQAAAQVVDQALSALGRIDIIVSPVSLSYSPDGAAGERESRLGEDCDRLLFLSRALAGARHRLRFLPRATRFAADSAVLAVRGARISA